MGLGGSGHDFLREARAHAQASSRSDSWWDVWLAGGLVVKRQCSCNSTLQDIRLSYFTICFHTVHMTAHNNVRGLHITLLL